MKLTNTEKGTLLKTLLKTLAGFFSDNPTVPAISCEFEGSGDEGAIHDSFPIAEWRQDMLYEWLPAMEGIQFDPIVEEAAKEVVYAALEKQGIDWYNNDGGFGVGVIDRELRVHLRTESRYTQTNTYTNLYKPEADGLVEKED